jgi:hypothetical protein
MGPLERVASAFLVYTVTDIAHRAEPPPIDGYEVSDKRTEAPAIRNPKNAKIDVRLRSDDRAALERLADHNRRSIGAEVRAAIARHVADST